MESPKETMVTGRLELSMADQKWASSSLLVVENSVAKLPGGKTAQSKMICQNEILKMDLF